MQSDSILQKRELFAVSLRKKKTRCTIESKRRQQRLSVEASLLTTALSRVNDASRISESSNDRILQANFKASAVAKELLQSQQNLLVDFLLQGVEQAAQNGQHLNEAISLLYKYLYIDPNNLLFFIHKLKGNERVKALIEGYSMHKFLLFYFAIQAEALSQPGIDPIVGLNLYHRLSTGSCLKVLVSFVLESGGLQVSVDQIEQISNHLKSQTGQQGLEATGAAHEEECSTASICRQAILRLGIACLPSFSFLEESDLPVPFAQTINALASEFIALRLSDGAEALEFLIQACELFLERSVTEEGDLFTKLLLGAGGNLGETFTVSSNFCTLFKIISPYFFNCEKRLCFLKALMKLKRSSDLQAPLLKLLFEKGSPNLIQTHWLGQRPTLDFFDLVREKRGFVFSLLKETYLLQKDQNWQAVAEVSGCPDHSTFSQQVISPCLTNIVLPTMQYQISHPDAIRKALKIVEVLALIVLWESGADFNEEFLALLDQLDLQGHIDKVLQSEHTARCNSGIVSMEYSWRKLQEEVQSLYSLLEKLAERANEEAAVLEQARSGRMLI